MPVVEMEVTGLLVGAARVAAQVLMVICLDFERHELYHGDKRCLTDQNPIILHLISTTSTYRWDLSSLPLELLERWPALLTRVRTK